MALKRPMSDSGDAVRRVRLADEELRQGADHSRLPMTSASAPKVVTPASS